MMNFEEIASLACNLSENEIELEKLPATAASQPSAKLMTQEEYFEHLQMQKKREDIRALFAPRLPGLFGQKSTSRQPVSASMQSLQRSFDADRATCVLDKYNEIKGMKKLLSTTQSSETRKFIDELKKFKMRSSEENFSDIIRRFYQDERNQKSTLKRAIDESGVWQGEELHIQRAEFSSQHGK